MIYRIAEVIEWFTEK